MLSVQSFSILSTYSLHFSFFLTYLAIFFYLIAFFLYLFTFFPLPSHIFSLLSNFSLPSNLFLHFFLPSPKESEISEEECGMRFRGNGFVRSLIPASPRDEQGREGQRGVCGWGCLRACVCVPKLATTYLSSCLTFFHFDVFFFVFLLLVIFFSLVSIFFLNFHFSPFVIFYCPFPFISLP